MLRIPNNTLTLPVACQLASSSHHLRHHNHNHLHNNLHNHHRCRRQPCCLFRRRCEHMLFKKWPYQLRSTKQLQRCSV
jgi:hypothetical protein